MIGKAITYYRELRNMSKVELADKTGISNASITQYENGNRNPSEGNLVLLAEALGVSIGAMKERAEHIEKSFAIEPVVDDYQYKRRLDFIYGNNDFVLELSKGVLLGIRARVHDVPFEVAERPKRPGFPRERAMSPIDSIVEKVLRDVLRDHADEIAYRIEDELSRTKHTVEEIIENIRKNYDIT